MREIKIPLYKLCNLNYFASKSLCFVIYKMIRLEQISQAFSEFLFFQFKEGTKKENEGRNYLLYECFLWKKVNSEILKRFITVNMVQILYSSPNQCYMKFHHNGPLLLIQR